MRDRYRRSGWAQLGRECLSMVGNGCLELGTSVGFQNWACGLGNGAKVSGMRGWGLQKVTVVTLDFKTLVETVQTPIVTVWTLLVTVDTCGNHSNICSNCSNTCIKCLNTYDDSSNIKSKQWMMAFPYKVSVNKVCLSVILHIVTFFSTFPHHCSTPTHYYKNEPHPLRWNHSNCILHLCFPLWSISQTHMHPHQDLMVLMVIFTWVFQTFICWGMEAGICGTLTFPWHWILKMRATLLLHAPIMESSWLARTIAMKDASWIWRND